MKHAICVAGIVLLSLCALAQQVPTAQEPPKIDQLLWMVGEWKTVEHDNGKDLLVRMSVKKSENGQALLFYVWFEADGKVTPKYNGMYYWDPGAKTYKLLQVSNDGTVGEGTYEQTGNRVQQLVKTTSDKGSMEVKSEWEIRPREFHFVALFRPDGKTEWAPAVDATYTRMDEVTMKPHPQPKRDDK
jgi:hypothetical protein